MKFRFPFGQPVVERDAEASGKQVLFILGAYPSALHVAWQPPAPYRKMHALAVENEPDVFWDGSNQEAFIARWMDSIGFDPLWGKVTSAGNLNGSSGKWVNENILLPFGATREDAFLTDCLNTYRSSKGGAIRLHDTYAPFAAQHGLLIANLPPHPNEDTIVSESLSYHKARLLRQIQAVHPKKIITLGNAALRVLGQLITATSDSIPYKLSSNPQLYGRSLWIETGEATKIEWWPLAHPAAPLAYQEAHEQWKNARK